MSVGLVWCSVLYGSKRAIGTIAKMMPIVKSSFPTVFNNQLLVILKYYEEYSTIYNRNQTVYAVNQPIRRKHFLREMYAKTYQIVKVKAKEIT
jgi:hypothetical protein